METYYSKLSRKVNTMNDQNGIRYLIKLLKRCNESTEAKIIATRITVATRYVGESYCFGCPEDDFGYCYQRKTSLSDKEVQINWCLNQIINRLERYLKSLQVNLHK